MNSLPNFGLAYHKVAIASPPPAKRGSRITSLPFHLGASKSFHALISLAATSFGLKTKGGRIYTLIAKLYCPASSAKLNFLLNHGPGSRLLGPTRYGWIGITALTGIKPLITIVVPWTSASTL